jgi:GAF domain-containing protein
MVKQIGRRRGGEPDNRLPELEHTIQTLREDTEVLHVLVGLSSALMEVTTLQDTLDKAVRSVRDTFGAERCFAAALDPLHDRFEITTALGFEPEVEKALEASAQGRGGLPLLRAAIEQESPVLIEDVIADGRMHPEEFNQRRLGAFIGIPLKRAGEHFGAVGIEFGSTRSFGRKEEALARGIARQVAVALTNARRFNLLQVLRSVGVRVGRSRLNVDAVARDVAAGAAELLSADAAALYLVDPDQGLLVRRGSHALGEDVLERLATMELAGHLSRLLAGEIVSLPDLSGELALGTPMSAVAAPVPGATGSIVAAIVLFFSRYFRIGQEEADALQVLAAQAGSALDDANHFERQRHVSQSLQQALLPSEVPRMEGWEVDAVYEPASGDSDVGGDFYDVFDLPDGRFGIVIGDVSGKGAEAAAQTAMAKYMLRAFASRNPAPSSALYHLNNALAKGMAEDRFTTLLYAVFDPTTRSLQLALAGHPPPLVYRAKSRSVETITVEGPVLGLFADQSFGQVNVELAGEDMVIGYTDGILEARSNGDFFGLEGLQTSVARHAANPATHSISRRVYMDANKFGTVGDDTIVLTLCFRPS